MHEKKEVMTEQNGKKGAEVVPDFTDLPMGLLISQPFLEIAKGQAALCEVYLETLAKLAYDMASSNENNKTRVLNFEYTKSVVDKATGKMKDEVYTINAPLLSLVPVPAFFMEEPTVSFSMDVNESTSDTSQSKEEASMGLCSSFWGVKASMSGKVSSNNTKSKQSY